MSPHRPHDFPQDPAYYSSQGKFFVLHPPSRASYLTFKFSPRLRSLVSLFPVSMWEFLSQDRCMYHCGRRLIRHFFFSFRNLFYSYGICVAFLNRKCDAGGTPPPALSSNKFFFSQLGPSPALEEVVRKFLPYEGLSRTAAPFSE